METATPVEGSKQTETGATQEFFVKSYKDREAAEKGIEEKDKTISRLQNEIQAAGEKTSQLETQVLARLAEAQASSRPEQTAQPTEARVEEMVKEIASSFANSEEDGARKFMAYASALSEDAKDAALEQAKDLIEDRDKKMAEQFSQLQGVLKERDPDWVAHKDQVNALAEQMNVEVTDDNRDLLMQVVKSQNSTEHPSRHDLPGATTTTRVVADDGGAAVPEGTDALLERAGFKPVSDAEKAQFKQVRKNVEMPARR